LNVAERAPTRRVSDLAPQPVREPSRARLGRCLGRLGRSERGTAVVEFSLVALPLCLIVFGILHFGRALNYYNDLTQIAGQGARAAAVNQNPLGGAADNLFQHQLACEGNTNELKSRINVQITHAPTNAGDPVTVTASFVFQFIPLVRPVSLTLSASQTERYESSAAPTYSASNDVTGGVGTCP
jgi:Flp pilus assembly protein TadG